MAAEGTTRAVLVAFGANLCIAVAKFVGWSLTGAASLLAEAVHSTADSGNQLLLLLGSARSQRPPTPEHPFGYGRERYFWAFIVAVVLFALGSVFAIYEGVQKLQHPHELASPIVAVGILVLALALEGYALRTAAKEASKHKGDESWLQFVLQAKSAALPVILLEDFGALVGLTIALICVGLTALTGDPTFDALGSLGIGLLLGVISVLMGVEMKSLLIGEAATPEVERAIRAELEAHPSVERFVHLRTQHLGPEELLIGAKVTLDPSLPLETVSRVINEIEASIRAREPAAKLIYIEPDVWREPVSS